MSQARVAVALQWKGLLFVHEGTSAREEVLDILTPIPSQHKMLLPETVKCKDIPHRQ